MAQVVLTSKGQMTLPKEVRDDLQVGPGDRLEITKQGTGYLIRRKRSAMELAGILHRPGEKSRSIEEIDEALGEALLADDERIRAGR